MIFSANRRVISLYFISFEWRSTPERGTANYNDHTAQTALLASRFLAGFIFNHSRVHFHLQFMWRGECVGWWRRCRPNLVLVSCEKKYSRFRPTQLLHAAQTNSIRCRIVRFSSNAIGGPFGRTQFPFTFVAARASHVQWSSTAASSPFSCLALIAF